MIRRILIGFVIATVVTLFILWLITGGPGKIWNTAKTMGNPMDYFFFGGSGGGFRLPWQPDNLYGPIIEIPEGTAEAEDEVTVEQELAYAQKEYDELSRRAEAAKTFGDPSPHRGSVYIGAGTATEAPPREYLELEASGGNTAPISITGWSVQSALTGVRAYIPRGSTVFGLGLVNEQSDIHLNAGARALLSSSPSPVGTSFRENICSGYLGRLQAFSPALSSSCPAPAESMHLTPDNLRLYGDECYDFVQQLPSCTLPRDIPAEVSPACRIFLMNSLSYNGCVEQYRYRSDFLRPTWRLYLSTGGELWRNTHDVIRLLDREGRTVDVVSY